MNSVLMSFDASCPVPDARESDGEGSLVARLRAGDQAALGDAYDLHHAHVRAFARRFLGDDAAAEDLVQETFVALPGAIRGYAADARLRTFLIGIAINHARHHVRAASRRRAAASRLAVEPPPSTRTPEHQAQRAELAAQLSRALDDLPVDQRAAFVLCEVEERTSVEAARIMGVPEGTVRTRLFHAKKKLRAILEVVR